MKSQAGLNRLRGEIDRIDDAILDLIEKRIALSSEIAAAKACAADELLIRPRREAEVVSRLQSRKVHSNPESIEIIWRELIGQGRQAQARLELLLWSSGDRRLFEACVKRHFGAAAPIGWADGPEAAIDGARTGNVVAVLDHRPSELSDGLIIFDVIRDPAGEDCAFAVGRLDEEEAAV